MAQTKKMGFFQLFGTVIAQELGVILGGSRLLHNQKNRGPKRQRKEISEFLWAQGGPWPSISHFTSINNMQNGTFSLFILPQYMTIMNMFKQDSTWTIVQNHNTTIQAFYIVKQYGKHGVWLVASGFSLWYWDLGEKTQKRGRDRDRGRNRKREEKKVEEEGK